MKASKPQKHTSKTNTRNTSTVVGVNWHNPSKQWRAVLMINGKYMTRYKGDDYLGAVKERWEMELSHYGFDLDSPAYRYLLKHNPEYTHERMRRLQSL